MGVTSTTAGCRSWARSGAGAGQRLPGWAACEDHPPRRRVVVELDGSPESAAALARAASQARQRNATLDVVRVVPDAADDREVTLARVALAEFIRRACPDGVGAPMRLRVERGDTARALRAVGPGAEVVITAHPERDDHLTPARRMRPA